MNGITSLLQHSFSGAFRVLTNSSLYSTDGLTPVQEIIAHFSTGGLQFKGVEVLRKGMVRERLLGLTLIHSPAHLERPSAAITIRTKM